MIKNLNILKILKIDAYFNNFLMFIIVSWCLFILVYILFNCFGRFYIGKGHYIDYGTVTFFLNISLLITPFFSVGLLARVIQFKLLLKNHVLVNGQFRSFESLNNGYSSITYYFEYNNKKYYDNKYIPKRNFVFPKMRKFKNGDELHFIFNPKNPKRNLILELYDINIDV